MAKPKRIQLKRTKGWRMPKNAVKVDRTTIYGNPFRVGTAFSFTHHGAMCNTSRVLLKWAEPGETMTLYLSDFDAVALYREYLDRFPIDLSALRGKNLACWCHPKAKCHADVLLELANK